MPFIFSQGLDFCCTCHSEPLDSADRQLQEHDAALRNLEALVQHAPQRSSQHILSDRGQIVHFNKGSVILAVFMKLLLAGRFPSLLLGLARPKLDTPLLVRPSIYTRFKS